MDWQTGEPPMDREIEIETTGGQSRRGQLARAGSYGITSGASGRAPALRDQFRIKDGAPEMFEVKRWREISAE